jgi:hypothetical protein
MKTQKTLNVDSELISKLEKDVDISSYKNTRLNSNFKSSVVITKRGKSGGTYFHPLLFVY